MPTNMGGAAPHSTVKCVDDKGCTPWGQCHPESVWLAPLSDAFTGLIGRGS